MPINSSSNSNSNSNSNSSENMYIIKTVIASEAKQSIAQQKEKNGLLRRFAPRNDGVGSEALHKELN